MATPHNQANYGDIAKTVIMPGDPLRAKNIAETFLEDVVQFNATRNMLGYTGTYKGKRVSVMGSGMGIPSIGLYSYELYKFYDVENIIRVGSTGAYSLDLDVYDTILVTGAYSESSFAKNYCGWDDKMAYPDKELYDKLKKSAETNGIKVFEGEVKSADVFYYENGYDKKSHDEADEMNLLAVEMESFGLFTVAKSLNKKAATLLTVSDHLKTHADTTPEERVTSMTDMIKIALDADIY